MKTTFVFVCVLYIYIFRSIFYVVSQKKQTTNVVHGYYRQGYTLESVSVRTKYHNVFFLSLGISLIVGKFILPTTPTTRDLTVLVSPVEQ